MEEPLEEFKEMYLEMLREIGGLDIIASIGNESSGKSFFLDKVYGDDIPNKHNQHIQKGTKGFHKKIFDDEFVLLDMECLGGTGGIISRDILNFTATYAFAEVLLLHISQYNLEKQSYIENFAYIIWQSSKSLEKYKFNTPTVILLIRDPRNTGQNQETVDYYNKLAWDFESQVNSKISDYEVTYLNSMKITIEREGRKMSKEEKKNNENTLKEIDRMINIQRTKIHFKIDLNYCIYFESSCMRPSIYYEVQEDCTFKESTFESLKYKITKILAEKHQELKMDSEFNSRGYFNVDNDDSRRIHEAITYASVFENSKETLFLNFWMEIKCSAFARFRNTDGFMRFMESYNRYYHKFKEISKNIAKTVKINTSVSKKLELQRENRMKMERD